MTTPSKLSFSEKAGYALGDAACNFYWKTFEFFLLFFYTDVFGLTPAAAGTMFAAARIIDGLADPVMGLIADRTETRWGKFRPYLLWLALPNAVAAVLTFTTPGLGDTGRLVYAYVTYTLMMLAFTAINIPYSALMGVMTADSRERTSLSSFRFAGAFTAGLVVVWFTKRLVSWLGADDPARGWQLTMGFWGLVSTAMFVVCFRATRERIRPAVTGPDVRAELGGVARNGPLLVLALLSVIVMTAFWIRSASSLYYFKYVVGREGLFEVFAVASALAMIAGIALTGPLTRWLGGKKPAYIAVMATSHLLVLLFYVVPPSNVPLLFALSLLIAGVLGPQSPLLFAMYADTADYAEWKTGRRATGLVFAAATFALKVGGAFAGWITGVLLAASGYAANQAQSAESAHGILLLMSVVPGAIGLVAAGTLVFYPLDEAFVRLMGAELAARRSTAAPGD
jgi:glycoside/pentoside/hexuronide:cation symporter, GPH family